MQSAGKRVGIFLVFTFLIFQGIQVGSGFQDNSIDQTLAIESNLSIIEYNKDTKIVKSQYTETDRIHIDGNDQLKQIALEKGWSGSGKASDPFIITGYNFLLADQIDEPFLDIKHIDLHVKIYDNIFQGHSQNSTAILVTDYGSIIIESNQFVNLYWGIKSSPDENSISHSLIIRKNMFTNIGFGAISATADNVLIEYNTLDSGKISGHGTSFGANATSVRIQHNRGLNSVYTGSWAKQAVITNNTGDGMDLYGVQNGYVLNNTLDPSNIINGVGISISYSDLVTISRNFISNCKYGIQTFLVEESANPSILVENNTITEVSNGVHTIYPGVSISLSRNQISGFGNNTGYGVYAVTNDFELSLTSNTISDFDYGIGVAGGNITLWGNTFISNQRLWFGDDGSDIRFNNFIDIGDLGQNIYDDHFFFGNYFQDHTNVDVNADGIADSVYVIDVNNTDSSPVVFNHTVSEFSLNPITTPVYASFTLSWTAAESFQLGYDIQYYVTYSDDGGLTWEQLGSPISATSYFWDISDENIYKGGEYIVRIIAFSPATVSQQSYSGVITFDIRHHAMTAPDITSPLSGVFGSVFTLEWSAATDNRVDHMLRYSVSYSGNGYPLTTLHSNITELSLEVDLSGLPSGTYTLEVEAYDGTGLFQFDQTTIDLDIDMPDISNPADQSGNVGDTFTISWTIGDKNPGTYDIMADSSTEVSGQAWTNGTIDFDFTSTIAGSFIVEITVKDSLGNENSDEVTIIVSESGSESSSSTPPDDGSDEGGIGFSILFYSLPISLIGGSWFRHRKSIKL